MILKILLFMRAMKPFWEHLGVREEDVRPNPNDEDVRSAL